MARKRRTIGKTSSATKRRRNRDDFPARVRTRVAHRAGYLCSNPGCGRNTAGPSDESPDAISNTGVAAHICAAAPGGRRYKRSMTIQERSSIANAIWLCSSCSVRVDRDAIKYTEAVLKEWKTKHEVAMSRLRRQVTGTPGDADVLSHLARALDRPAFYTPFGHESSMADFRQAITDTIEALNTGLWRSRDRAVIARLPSRHNLTDTGAKEALADIVDRLVRLRARFDEHLAAERIKICGTHFHAGTPINVEMDRMRREILLEFATVYPDFRPRMRVW
jgi:hypothetical protein